MSIFQKGINPGAYQGKLTCPYTVENEQKQPVTCGSSAVRYVEHVTPFRLRYRCRKCGGTFQYDISNHPNANPYAPFLNNGKFRDNVDNITRGRKLKGVLK